MAEFLVELYAPGGDRDAARRQTARAEQAAADESRAGNPIGCRWAVHVPEDETCLVLYDAPSADDVQAALVHAGLAWEHVSAAVTWTTPHPTSPGRPADGTSTTTRKEPPA